MSLKIMYFLTNFEMLYFILGQLVKLEIQITKPW